jgi:regulation of enolase protein 1 (concanavalin A-like superfamily)
LREADVPRATRVIVTVADDAVALRILCAVRRLNDQAIVMVAFHEPHWREVGLYLGADRVVEDASPPDDCTCEIEDLVFVERAVLRNEVGLRLSECAPEVLAATRENTRHWRDQAEPHVLREGDLLLEVCAEQP